MNTAIENTRDMGELGRFKLKNPTNSLSTKSTKFPAKTHISSILPQGCIRLPGLPLLMFVNGY